jgi:hypothetical protein
MQWAWPNFKNPSRRLRNDWNNFNQSAEALILPKRLEPLRRQLGVAHRMLDVLVSELALYRTCLARRSRACTRRHAAACEDAPGTETLPSPLIRASVLRNPAADIGARRSVANTCGDSACSRNRRSRARISVPPIGCTLCVPFLRRRT